MDYKELAADLIKKTQKAGATAAEVYLLKGSEVHIEISQAKVQKLTRAGLKGAGLRTFLKGKISYVSSSDLSPQALNKLVKKAIAFAKESNAEEYNTLPQEKLTGEVAGLEIYDASIPEVPIEKKLDMAKEMEQIAFDYSPKINKTRASYYSDFTAEKIIANSNGLLYSWKESRCSLGISLVAEDEDAKQAAGYSASKRFFKDLPATKGIAEEAARRALWLIGGEKVGTQKVSVVFDARVGPILIYGVLGGVNGESVYRNQSFLVGKLDQKIASDWVTIMDDGKMTKGLGTAPVDGEGVPTRTKTVVDKGVLKLYLYNTYTANKAGTKSTGNASRGSYDSAPGIGPTNFYLQAGTKSREEIIHEVKNGLYVLDIVGGGPNSLTGDFSCGVAGLWIRNGKLAEPVAKITIASTLLDMLKSIDAVGNDLEFYSSIVTPTFRIREMTVSGK